ncbi:MAG TPA: NUDIX hydrolase [Candidatus Acidoferrales bacterium]|nr:NUDIX hydrolase [Candidatus Acidoferrales bacterium]
MKRPRKRGVAKVLSSKIAFRGAVFGVRTDRVVEPGGVQVTRDIVTHPGSVVVLPVFPNGDILLIRQYRHSIGKYLWELVAGRIELGEAPLAAARRELLEETGYTARRFRRLLVSYPTPGFVSENMIIFVAEGLREGTSRPEEDERITLRRFSRKEIELRLRSGALRDAKTIAGILYYWRFRPSG